MVGSDEAQEPEDDEVCVLQPASPGEKLWNGEDLAACIRDWWKATEEQDSEALFELWRLYEYGKIAKNSETRKWFRLTAEFWDPMHTGYPRSSYKERYAELTTADEIEGIEWYRKIGEPYIAQWVQSDYDLFAEAVAHKANQAVTLNDYLKDAESGDVSAMYSLGTMSLEGHLVPYDEVMAVKWLRKAAEHGETMALDDLWELLDEPIYDDIKETISWFSMMAEKGDAAMKYRLAEWLHDNEWPEAIEWYRKAAEQGDIDAQRTLGDLYRVGDGVAQDSTEACAWYHGAAERGDVEAQYGWWSIFNEERFPGGREDAAMWCRKAAERGHAGAQADLGQLCATGDIVERDLNEAAWWYLKAAEQGHSIAQLRVGELFHQRIRETHVEAYKWFILCSSSCEELRDEAQRRMEAIRSEMTPEMIGEAEKRAREWGPKGR